MLNFGRLENDVLLMTLQCEHVYMTMTCLGISA